MGDNRRWRPLQLLSVASAATNLPPNVPLLQNLFALTINNPTLQSTAIGLHVNGILRLLAQTNPQVLQVSPGADVQDDVGEDPVMYFYEPFLHSYSPRTAEARGVYYTPLAAVRAIVRLADSVAKNSFARQLGLADPNVYLLDPAIGTGTFLAEIARQISRNVEEAGDAGLLQQYLHQRFLANSYGFEFLAAPYTIAHLKLSRILQEEFDLTLQADERIKIYLTNTLQTPTIAAPALPFMEQLAAETREAARVKTEQPLLIILGNPPWSGHSENLNINLSGVPMVEPFKWCDGQKVRQTKWLNNDYVKFLRWVQWRITESDAQQGNNRGVVAFITDNSFLSSPTFRGMRRFLLTQFDDIHIFNLHGRSRGGSEGEDDENIFAIQQGVCISIFIRSKGNIEDSGSEESGSPDTSSPATNYSPFLTLRTPLIGAPRLSRSERRAARISTSPIRARITYQSSGKGQRRAKYEWLNNLRWDHVQGASPLRPEAPYYFFKPFEADAQYWSWLSLNELFGVSGMCVTTARDDLVTDFTRAELSEKMELFKSLSSEDAKEQLDVHDTSDWSVERAQERLQFQNTDDFIQPYLFRPFDERVIYYSNAVVKRPVEEVFSHLIGENVALVTILTQVADEPYRYAFVSRDVVNKKALSTEANCYAFPLYFQTVEGEQRELDGIERGSASDNIRPEVIEQLMSHYGVPVRGESIFHYIYAVMNAANYRELYSDQLRVDFPHIPFPTDVRLFETLAQLGQQLVQAHLKDSVASIQVTSHIEANSEIQASRISYDSVTQAVIFNNAGARFSGITSEMWNYHIGSYQPLERWLKERSGRRFVLDYSEDNEGEVLIDDYRTIVRAIAASVPIHRDIDESWTRLTSA